jgi:hypothetical protein
MKKITLLLAFIGMISLNSCTVNEEQPINVQDNDTISEVWEYTRSFTPSNNFSNLIIFPRPIFTSDMVLVYRLSGVDNGVDIWKLLPETYYFNDGTLDFRYDFDFTRFDASIFMDGFDLGGVSPNFRINQVLRVVIIPGFFGNRTTNNTNFNNYNAVIKAYKIDETKIIKIK